MQILPRVSGVSSKFMQMLPNVHPYPNCINISGHKIFEDVYVAGRLCSVLGIGPNACAPSSLHACINVLTRILPVIDGRDFHLFDAGGTTTTALSSAHRHDIIRPPAATP
jgi:hypothetical protein